MTGARWATVLVALGGLLPAGCLSVGAVETGDLGAGSGYADERGEIQMVSTLVGGKNVFIPATVVVTEGSGRTLSIYNTTDTPHGFRIPALRIETVLMPGQETKIALPPLAGGHIHEMVCHLHPPHRTATLVVVHGR